MNMLLLVVVLLLLFGGGGFYIGGPVIGGSGLGLILLICLCVYFAGGFRTTKRWPAMGEAALLLALIVLSVFAGKTPWLAGGWAGTFKVDELAGLR